MIRTAVNLASLALCIGVAGCAAKEAPIAAASEGAGDSLAAESLSGPYRVIEVDGDKALTPFNVSFETGSFGGNDGCNGYFGSGFGYRDTYYSGVASSTLLGCSASTSQGQKRLSQGQSVAFIVMSKPKVVDLGKGRYRLSAFANEMVIEGSPNVSGQVSTNGSIPLAGSSWEAFLLNDKRADVAKTLENQYLRFADTTFTARFSCRFFSGKYKADGVRLTLSEVAIEQRGDCSTGQDGEDAALLQLLSGEIGFIATENEIVLGSPSGTLSGDQERKEYKVR